MSLIVTLVVNQPGGGGGGGGGGGLWVVSFGLLVPSYFRVLFLLPEQRCQTLLALSNVVVIELHFKMKTIKKKARQGVTHGSYFFSPFVFIDHTDFYKIVFIQPKVRKK